MNPHYSRTYVFSMVNRGVTPETAADYTWACERREAWLTDAAADALGCGTGVALLISAFTAMVGVSLLVGAVVIGLILVDARRHACRQYQRAYVKLTAELHEYLKPTAQQVVEDLRRD